jgi:hypothetical protein
VDGTTGTTWDVQNTPDAHNTNNGGGGGDIPLLSGGGTFLKIEGYNSGAPATAEIVVTDPNDLTYGLFPDQTTTVSPDMLTRALNEGKPVTLQANDDITIDSPITANPKGKPRALTLDAGRSIILNAGINTSGGNLFLVANDTVADGVIDSQRGPGNAAITMASGATLSAGAGALSVQLRHSTDKTNNASGVVTLLGVTAGGTTLSPVARLGITINGTKPGDGIAAGTYTQVDVTGPINLNDAPLQVTNNLLAAAGDTFTIVQTSGGVTGTFRGLPEGARVAASDGSLFTISYQGDGGKAVVLTAIPAAPGQLVITVEPSSTATAGLPFAIQPIVQEEDRFGNVVTSDSTHTVTAMRGSHGTAGLKGGTLKVQLIHGVGAFSGLYYTRAETMNLTFAVNRSGVSTVTSTDVVVSPAGASQLVITQQPSAKATVGVAFATQPIVKEEDPYGNVIKSDSTSTVTAARGSKGTASLQGSKLTVTLVNGVAKFRGLHYNKAQTMNIKFTANASEVSAASSNDVVVSTAPAAPTQPVIPTSTKRIALTSPGALRAPARAAAATPDDPLLAPLVFDSPDLQDRLKLKKHAPKVSETDG